MRSQVPYHGLTGSSHLPATIRGMPNFLPELPPAHRKARRATAAAARTTSPRSGARLRLAALAVGAAALPALAGCGGGSARQVASIPSSGGAASSAPAGSSGGSGGQPAGTQKFNLQGVTLPDNASPAERKRIFNAWAGCLEAHGDHAIATKSDGTMVPASTPVPPAPAKACQSLHPHSPWQEIPADNPNYNQDMANWINCLNTRGVHVRATSQGWTFTSTNVPPNEHQIEVQCEMQAFGEH
jgi:hypothetical protein